MSSFEGKYKYTWKPQPKDVRDFAFEPHFEAEGFPISFDLRKSMPPIWNQQALGSCTAHSIAAIVSYAAKNSFNPSRLFIYYNERVIEGTVDQDSGAYLRDGIKAVATLGVCDEKSWTYGVRNFRDKPSDACYTEAKSHIIKSYHAIAQDRAAIKTALIAGNPISFGFMVKSSFESDQVAKFGIYRPSMFERILGGHAVAIVGYDDKLNSYIVRNSWSDSWGLKGYFYMPYSEVENPRISNDFWVVQGF